jgi:hypothetical protein
MRINYLPFHHVDIIKRTVVSLSLVVRISLSDHEQLLLSCHVHYAFLNSVVLHLTGQVVDNEVGSVLNVFALVRVGALLLLDSVNISDWGFKTNIIINVIDLRLGWTA